MSGTDIAYAATLWPVLIFRYWHSVCCYALSGTDTAYVENVANNGGITAMYGRKADYIGGRQLPNGRCADIIEVVLPVVAGELRYNGGFPPRGAGSAILAVSGTATAHLATCLRF
eukprot:445821-Rhodomonas_salina.1